jgi:hypothetical protein
MSQVVPDRHWRWRRASDAVPGRGGRPHLAECSPGPKGTALEAAGLKSIPHKARSRAANRLIPRWDLPQDERLAIFEERSHHIAGSLPYLPRIARRLYHSRDLGEPFDFITWFEFAPRDAAAFDELAGMLRVTEEWSYVEREVEIRLNRATHFQ